MAPHTSFVFFCAGGHRTGLGHLKRSRALCAAAKDLGYGASLLLLADDPAEPPMLLPGESVLPQAEELRFHTKFHECDGAVVVIDAPELADPLLVELHSLAGSLVLASPIFRSSKSSLFDLAVTRAPVKGLSANTQQEYGLKYAVFPDVDHRFDERRFEATLSSNPPRIGVCFGGSDPDNLTSAVFRHLRDHTMPFQLSLVVGPSFRHQSTLRSELDDSRHCVELIEGGDDPWASLCRCRAVLLGGGLMALEAASLGVPAVHIARNLEQRDLLLPLEAAKATVVCPTLGPSGVAEAARLLLELAASAPELRRIRSACRALSLDQGAVRCVQRILSFVDESNQAALVAG